MARLGDPDVLEAGAEPTLSEEALASWDGGTGGNGEQARQRGDPPGATSQSYADRQAGYEIGLSTGRRKGSFRWTDRQA